MVLLTGDTPKRTVSLQEGIVKNIPVSLSRFPYLGFCIHMHATEKKVLCRTDHLVSPPLAVVFLFWGGGCFHMRTTSFEVFPDGTVFGGVRYQAVTWQTGP